MRLLERNERSSEIGRRSTTWKRVLHALRTTVTTTLAVALLASPSRVVVSGFAASSTATSSSLSMSGGGGGGGVFEKRSRGRLLVLGGSGFLGNAVATKAVLEGYAVTSLSRRGAPSRKSDDDDDEDDGVDYRTGDARDGATIRTLLAERDDYVGVAHCVGLLFDGESRLGNLNRLVSGSGSRPAPDSTYDDITRVTAFEAIAAAEAALPRGTPFLFASAAEAGWPDVRGGPFVERTLAPGWLRRYLAAKRAVEARLDEAGTAGRLRPVVFRPSLVYSLDRPASLPPVSAFYVGNRVLRLPFVDRPVTVQALANAFVRAVGDETVRGVQRFADIDALNDR